MWTKRCKGLTLIELLIAAVIFGIIVSATIIGLRFMGRLSVDREAAAPAITGARAMEYFFNRVLRANATEVLEDGRALSFRVVEAGGASRWAKLGKGADNTLVYDYDINDAEGPEIVERGIQDVRFVKDQQDRVSMELEVSTEEVFHSALKHLSTLAEEGVQVNPATLNLRTSVRPRNIPTPQDRIN